ncbi:hypothetical protein [Roseovarius aestuariivivens]|uniref:hypothetical protein n=1 Tax=Roseovarius aestuariivivens TaxID=1888910 RepID=UPI0010810CD2|nr:hypothetical protein [Roseovarius aestuariivivens]
MRITSYIAAALTVAVLGGPAMAEGPKVYAYPSKHNYCPQGLQPVTISGVICCGTPNQSMTYQQVKAHPLPKKRHYHSSRARSVGTCREGEKGCY